jgi:hypothetical protein
MTVTVRTADELGAALDGLVAQRIDRSAAAAVREAAVFCFTQWTSGKFTWSKFQPNDVWSGQSRESVNIGIGAPDPKFAPANLGPWPNHPSPYGPRDPFEARFRLDGLAPYQAVYVSDSAPNTMKVEAHTQVAHSAAAFTRAHFAPGHSWSGVLAQSHDAPF